MPGCATFFLRGQLFRCCTRAVRGGKEGAKRPKENCSGRPESGAQRGCGAGPRLARGRHSLVSCVSSFAFRLLTAGEARNFVQFSLSSVPRCGALRWKFISYLSWKLRRKMALSVGLLVQRDGIEPRAVLQAPELMPAPVGGKAAQRSRGTVGKTERGDRAVGCPPGLPQLELRDAKGDQ